ncbi:efflux RND transporter permease subunit [Rathayibacter sp. YIM 133350]|uniref:efflux RND transporter permease subunit n=1 Tax=Rathayibacter sp. YIM 133350 TaxID=3131992 RepID=UPI00307F8AD4
MHSLAALSMKNRALIALVTIVVAIFGGIALSGLKQELAPSIQFPQLSIVTSYPGASPDIVNTDLSTPIETSIQGITGLESTSTTSSTGLSVVRASFTYGTDLAFAEQKLLSSVNRIKSQLPDDTDPQVVALSLDDIPVIQVAVTGVDDVSTLSDEIKRTTIGEIKDVDGVRDATLVGDVGQRVTITPDAAKLAARGLSASSIRDALQQNGVLIPAGTITQDDRNYSVQLGTKLTSVEDLSALPLIPSAPIGGGASAGAGASGSAGAGAGDSTGAQQPGAGGTDAGTGAGDTGAEAAVPLEVTPVAPATIGDVATVALADNPTTSISRVNGEPALTIAVTKLPAANTVEVSTGVRDRLPDLESSLDSTNPGAKFTVVFDQAPYIQQSIESLATEGLLGLGFAVVIILIFLLSVRATLVTAISIPTSVLITFIGLQVSGYTLNVLTLGALTIAIGRVVDDSIVVIENIKRHLVPGVDKAATIVHAVREVAGAITASTITTVAVFAPIALVSGVTGELFRPFAMTVTIALLASLLVALTIVPVLAYWFLRAPKNADAAAAAFVDEVETGATPAIDAAGASAHHGAHVVAVDAPEQPETVTVLADSAQEVVVADGNGASTANSGTSTATVAPAVAGGATGAAADELAHPTRLQRSYLPILTWTLKHSVVTIVIAVLVLGGTLALTPFMKTNFLGSSGQNTFQVSQTLPVGTSLSALDTASTDVEKTIRGTDGVETVQTSIGSGGSSIASAFGGGGGNRISYSITTADDADPDAVQADVRTELEKLDDVGDITVAASSGFGGSSNITVDITASNQDDLQKATDAVVAQAKKLDDVSDVASNLEASRPLVGITVDRTKAAEAGFSEVALSSYVSGVMQPQSAGSIVIDEKTLTIYIASANPPTTIDAVSAIEIPTATGPVRLDSLATVEQTEGPASVTTVKGLRSATVTVTPGSDNTGAASAEVQQAVDKAEIPAGTTASLGGVASDQSEAFSQLGLALLAAILIVYIVMVATFRSLLQPLLLLISVPFAATGAILLQVITGIPLGVASLVGVLMLIGIVVTNAIVLVDLVNQYRRRGMAVREAVVHGSSRRLRPILMTALATIFALLPMAIGLTGHGGFISQPLAIVVIGGLVSSTLLTLVVLPTLYNLVEGFRERRPERLDRRAARKQARRERKAQPRTGTGGGTTTDAVPAE